MERQKPTRQQRRAAERSGTDLPNQSGLITRRNFIGLALGGSVVVATGAIMFATEDNESRDSESASKFSLENQPLPEITPAEMQLEVSQTIDDYQRLTGIPINGDEVLALTTLVPDANKITSDRLHDLCPNGTCFHPEVGGATKNDRSSILIFKDAIDVLLENQKNNQQGIDIKNEVIANIFAHELSHWLTSYQGISDHMYDLVLKYFPEQSSKIKANYQLLPIALGAALGGKDPNSGAGFAVFTGLEEAEAEIIAQFVVTNRGKRVYRDFNKDAEDPYFGIQRSMVKKLMKRLNTDYGKSIRMLSAYRNKNGGREEYFRTVGQRFPDPIENELESGFKIFHAIETGNTQLFDQLTSK